MGRQAYIDVELISVKSGTLCVGPLSLSLAFKLLISRFRVEKNSMLGADRGRVLGVGITWIEGCPSLARVCLLYGQPSLLLSYSHPVLCPRLPVRIHQVNGYRTKSPSGLEAGVLQVPMSLDLISIVS